MSSGIGRLVTALFLGGAVCLVAGCGSGGKTVPVQGTVTLPFGM